MFCKERKLKKHGFNFYKLNEHNFFTSKKNSKSLHLPWSSNYFYPKWFDLSKKAHWNRGGHYFDTQGNFLQANKAKKNMDSFFFFVLASWKGKKQACKFSFRKLKSLVKDRFNFCKLKKFKKHGYNFLQVKKAQTPWIF